MGPRSLPRAGWRPQAPQTLGQFPALSITPENSSRPRSWAAPAGRPPVCSWTLQRRNRWRGLRGSSLAAVETGGHGCSERRWFKMARRQESRVVAAPSARGSPLSQPGVCPTAAKTVRGDITTCLRSATALVVRKCLVLPNPRLLHRRVRAARPVPAAAAAGKARRRSFCHRPARI